MSKNIKSVITLYLVLGMVLLITVSVVSWKYVERLSNNNNNIFKDYEYYQIFESINTDLLSLESKEKEYTISHKIKCLEEITERKENILKNINIIYPYFVANKWANQYGKYKIAVIRKLNNIDSSLNVIKAKNISTSNIYENEKSIELTNNLLNEVNNTKSYLSKDIYNDKIDSFAFVKEYSRWDILNFLFAFIIALVTGILLIRNLNKRNKLNIELEKSKAEADEALKIKEKFIANVSHEIRTPMNAIIGFTELLEKRETDAKSLDYIKHIKSSSENLLIIINDILDFSKLEVGKLQLIESSFSVSTLMHSVYNMFYKVAEERSISMRLVIDKDIPENIIGDATRLKQIVVNLVSNAIKFTKSGSIIISVSSIKVIKSDIQLQFSVKDTGIGIPEEKLDYIFERFSQINNDLSREYSGTGLGLSIVSDLIHLQNGTISVNSKTNIGSEFIFTLKYKLSSEINKQDENKKIIQNNRQKHKILIIEDNEINRKLMLEILNGYGYKTAVAFNGEEAVSILKQEIFDLIFMDLQMPVLDGFKTTELIRRELMLKTPIIALTAHTILKEKDKCLSYGMNDYLSKPFKETELMEVIEKHLKTDKLNDSIKLSKGATEIRERKVDLNYIRDLAKGNQKFIEQMLDLFLEQVPSELKQLQNEIKNSNFNNASTIAHKMKTSVGFLGISKFVEQDLELIENACKEVTESNALLSAYNRLEEILNEVYNEVKEERVHLS